MKKWNAIVHWLIYGGKKSNATTAALENALNSIAPGPPPTVISGPVTPASIAPAVATPAIVAPTVTAPAPVAAPVAAAASVAPAVATPALVATPVTAAASVAPAVAAPIPVTPVPATVMVDNVPFSTYSFVPQKPSASPSVAPTVDDPFEEFLVHMKSGKRPFRKPGMTVKQEFEAWLAHRVKTREAEAAAAARGRAPVKMRA